MAITTINPWHNKESGFSKSTFSYDKKAIFEHRGVQIFHNYSSWDYVISGMTIAQRAGFHKDSAPSLIDKILDGKQPCAEGVYNHLKSLGFSPISYEQYTKEWRAGRME